MNCFCEFLYDLLPSNSAKVQARASVATVLIAGRALLSWKSQEKHKIEIKLIESLHKTYNFITSIRNQFDNKLDTELQYDLEKGADFVRKKRCFNAKKKIDDNIFFIDEITSLMSLSIAYL